ncbi:MULTISPECIES: SRPBCC family protein [Pseudarthrobacter]|uniref:SRPBCC family protein n=1 Tax=Pseudarthrobacter TaxID=1742993 RepID=UPI001FCC9686|nr:MULTISPECIES: SRPBCC domain-containing protein [Pseudarthrobacter]
MPGTYDVAVVREFNAPLRRVCAAWTESGGLRQWWGPAGYTCPRAEADVRAGGRIRVTMRAPAGWGGFEQHSTWNFTEVQPLRRIR